MSGLVSERRALGDAKWGDHSQFVCVSIGQGWSIRIQYSYFKTFEYRIWVYSYLYLNNY